MNLMKENAESKKKIILSVICGVITIVAVLCLIVIASLIEMPAIIRVLLIIFAIATAVTGIGAASVLDAQAGYFECPNCKELFTPTMREYVKGCHTLTRRMLTCPKCGKRRMCKHRIKR